MNDPGKGSAVERSPADFSPLDFNPGRAGSFEPRPRLVMTMVAIYLVWLGILLTMWARP